MEKAQQFLEPNEVPRSLFRVRGDCRIGDVLERRVEDQSDHENEKQHGEGSDRVADEQMRVLEEWNRVAREVRRDRNGLH